MFKDRTDAAKQLVAKLKKFKDTNTIVLAVPRGGVPLGYLLAKELNLPLEIILSKKIGHPHNPEFAIGSVSLNGVIMNSNVMDVSKEYIKNEAARILATLKEKQKLFMGTNTPKKIENKTVIIIDDGVATGSTIISTIEALKNNKPKQVILAIPVAPKETIKKLSKLVDEVICLLTPDDFAAVGQFYEDFSQVSDEEVIKLIKESKKIKTLVN